MTDLRKVFAEQFKEMNKAAQANVKEADNAVTGITAEVERCLTKYENLQSEANQAQAKFGESAKTVRRMGRMQEGPSVEAVEQAEIPLEQYKCAKSQLPDAEKALEDAECRLEKAKMDLSRATADANAIKYFVS